MTDLLDASDAASAFRSLPSVRSTAPIPPASPSLPTPSALPAIGSGSQLVDRHLASGHDLELIVAPIGRTVVVVPHPDDEALAAGGLIAHQRARGRDVVVVAVTDGDAAYPDWNAVDLARVRRREQFDALQQLGVGRHALHHLGVPDGTVDRHVGEISASLLEILSPGDTLVAPAVFDWHPDHEACGRAAAPAADEVDCSLRGSLFWAHHHPDHAPDELSLGALALTDHEVADRRAAVHAHRSQLEPSPRTSADPILAVDLLGLLDRPVEYYVIGGVATSSAARVG
jgi:LmbE family N-acetylglucosaminyl deacetylase